MLFEPWVVQGKKEPEVSGRVWSRAPNGTVVYTCETGRKQMNINERAKRYKVSRGGLKMGEGTDEERNEETKRGTKQKAGRNESKEEELLRLSGRLGRTEGWEESRGDGLNAGGRLVGTLLKDRVVEFSQRKKLLLVDELEL